MRISIVVPAFNEERLIADSLAKVNAARLAFARRGWDHELIVCDNNSTDRTADLARAAGATVVFEPVNQIGRARNCGAAAAAGDWLVFVDADSYPTVDLFAEVAERIASGEVMAGGCTIQLDGEHAASAPVVRFWNWLSRRFTLLAGSFIFCERAAFREVGGFSHELFAGEELDLSAKLKKLARRRGKKVVILEQNPLLTSGRKVELYQSREHFWFFTKAVFARRRVLTSREQCRTWYDGRR